MKTTQEAAATLGLSVRAVQAHIAAGNIRAAKAGRDYLISDDEIERFMERRRPRGRPRRTGMSDQQLIALIKERGALWVAQQIRSAGIGPALDEGIDLTNWRVESAPGALSFYQVEHHGGGGRGILSPGSGLGAPRAPGEGWFVTDAPRVMVINAPRDEMWRVMAAEHVESGVVTTLLFSDGTEERIVGQKTPPGTSNT